MRLTHWLAGVARKQAVARRGICRKWYGDVACAAERLEDRTLLSVTSLYFGGQLTIVSDSGETIEVGSYANGNVQIRVDGWDDPALLQLDAGLIEWLTVIGGEGDNVIDLSGVNIQDYDFMDAGGDRQSLSGR